MQNVCSENDFAVSVQALRSCGEPVVAQAQPAEVREVADAVRQHRELVVVQEQLE
jgi:hypothetical protein